MTEYVSILSCISVEDSQGTEQTGTEEELDEEELKEVQETVEDLLSIQNPNILKRNLTTMVTENIKSKKKLKILGFVSRRHRASKISGVENFKFSYWRLR